MWTSFKRIIRAGFVGFWRNSFVSISAIFVMTIALFVIGSTMMLNVLLGVSLEHIQEKVDINVYFVTTASQIDIDLLQTSLEALPDVSQVIFTSREDALTSFTELHKDDETIMRGLEELGKNPLGASLAITANDIAQYESIASFLDDQKAIESPQQPLIDEINFQRNQEAINTLTSIIKTVENITFIIMIMLVTASILITYNTVRLTVYTNRDEISVMRLVGASNTFIRGPFMIQGIMYGLIAGLLSLLILYPLILWIGPGTEAFFQFNLFNYFVKDFGNIFMILVGSGVIMGFISSALAVSRYLRV